jgi:HEPN domain-containing protein
MKFLTAEWLNSANIDLIAAENLLQNECLTSSVIFHCQQSIEKSFKAILVENNCEPMKIHDLLRLYSMVREFIDPLDDTRILKIINEAYIDNRYPGELGLLPNGKPNLSEAKECYKYANSIHQSILGSLAKM